jgi:hypothetical protein
VNGQRPVDAFIGDLRVRTASSSTTRSQAERFGPRTLLRVARQTGSGRRWTSARPETFERLVSQVGRRTDTEPSRVRAPVRVLFTDHAAERAVRYGISFSDAADAVLVGHSARRRNTGAGEWLVRDRGLAVVYDWPDSNDAAIARVITLWPEVA